MERSKQMKKLLKVIAASIFLSFMFSLCGALISHFTLVEKDPDTYYFSFTENLFFGVYFLTLPILLMSILAFLIYTLLGKRKTLSRLTKGIVSVIIAISTFALYVFIYEKNNVTNDIYLIPEGYEGDVLIFYNIKGAPKVKSEDGYEVHTINSAGYFVTSTPEMDYGTVTDKYYYVDKKGKRTPIPDTCVGTFGTGSFSSSENSETDISYTGLKLTKDNCGEDFMLNSYYDEENKSTIIKRILKKYYNVDPIGY